MLLHARWLSGCQWTGKGDLAKLLHILCVIVAAPFACIFYLCSPHRSHSRVRHPVLGMRTENFLRPSRALHFLSEWVTHDSDGLAYSMYMAGPLLRLLDRPINRFIVDVASYVVFLLFLLRSIKMGINTDEPKITE